VCFAAQHRKGSRKRHASKVAKFSVVKKAKLDSTSETNGHAVAVKAKVDSVCVTKTAPSDYLYLMFSKMDVENENDTDSDEELANATETSAAALGLQPSVGSTVGEWFVERSKFIPMRLTLSERKYLRLLEAALNVSEYTDRIDTIGFGLSKAKRVVHQIRELCAIMSGLVLSADYKLGQELFADRDFQANAEFYRQLFELGRRYKIMNPDKMRTTYGKLIYLLQVRIVLLLSCETCS
jgi:Protein of unknown function (DUF2009)